MYNTDEEIIYSKHGLLTTVYFQMNNDPPKYALEGSIANTGSLVQWLRDNLNLIDSSEEIELLANKVKDNGDVYIVCLLYTSPSPRDKRQSRMPSSA